MMKNAAIYARVSTDRQVREGDSIPAQLDALKAYIDGRDDLTLAGTYVDDGISGTRSDRDELQRLLADVDAGKVDIILVTKLDRLYRSIRHYLNMMEHLDRRGVGWLAIWEPIYDTTTPQGRLIVNQMMSIAQFEAENTGQRVRAVLAYKVAQGQVDTGRYTVGYKIVNKRLVIDEPAAEQVRAAFRTYNETCSIAATVRAAGPGMPATRNGMRSLLRRRIYIGEYHENANFCPPIIDRDLFDHVQVQLSRNIKRSVKQTYLFSGLLVCGECGRKFTSCLNASGHPRYRCHGYFGLSRSRKCQNKKSMTEKPLERYLLDNIADLIKGAVFEAEALAKPAKDAKKKRATVEKKLERLKALYLDEIITKEEYKRDREALTAELAAMDPVPEPLPPKVQAFDPVAGLDLYKTLDAEGKRFFWRQIIRKITVDSGGKITVFFL